MQITTGGMFIVVVFIIFVSLGRHVLRSSTLFTSLANLDLLDPFGKQDLVRGQATTWVRVEDGVDDIATLTLLGC